MVLCYRSLSRPNQGACDPVWASIRCNYRVLLGLLERRTFLSSCLEAEIMQTWSLQELLPFIPAPPTSMEKQWLKMKPIQWKEELKDREIDFCWYCLTNWIQSCLKLECLTLPLNEPPTATPPFFQSRVEFCHLQSKEIWPRYASSLCFLKSEGPATAFLRSSLLVYQEWSIQKTPKVRWLLFTRGTFQPGSERTASANGGQTYRMLDKPQCKLTSDG